MTRFKRLPERQVSDAPAFSPQSLYLQSQEVRHKLNLSWRKDQEAQLDRGEAYELLLKTMNEFRDQVVADGLPQGHSTTSRDILGRSGLLYAIEVEASTQADGRMLFKGSASEHNPHKFRRIEESFFS